MRFEFEEVNLKDIENEISNLSTKKAVASNSIPAKVLTETFDICSPVLQQIWHDEILKVSVSKNLKLADITPVRTVETYIFYLKKYRVIWRFILNELYT